VEAGVKEPENPPAPDGYDGFPDPRKVEFVTYVNGKLYIPYLYEIFDKSKISDIMKSGKNERYFRKNISKKERQKNSGVVQDGYV
jgi:hypothetical protein